VVLTGGNVFADKGYSSRANRDYLRRRGIRATIPERARPAGQPRPPRISRCRPPACDKTIYSAATSSNACFNRFKQYRAIAGRYDKTATSYQGMIDLASLLMWL
jgi:transposase